MIEARNSLNAAGSPSEWRCRSFAQSGDGDSGSGFESSSARKASLCAERARASKRVISKLDSGWFGWPDRFGAGAVVGGAEGVAGSGDGSLSGMRMPATIGAMAHKMIKVRFMSPHGLALYAIFFNAILR